MTTIAYVAFLAKRTKNTYIHQYNINNEFNYHRFAYNYKINILYK